MSELRLWTLVFIFKRTEICSSYRHIYAEDGRIRFPLGILPKWQWAPRCILNQPQGCPGKLVWACVRGQDPSRMCKEVFLPFSSRISAYPVPRWHFRILCSGCAAYSLSEAKSFNDIWHLGLLLDIKTLKKNYDNCILVQLNQASFQILCLFTHEISFELKRCSLWEAVILSFV